MNTEIKKKRVGIAIIIVCLIIVFGVILFIRSTFRQGVEEGAIVYTEAVEENLESEEETHEEEIIVMEPTVLSDVDKNRFHHTLDNLPEHETYTYLKYEGDYSDLNLSDDFISLIGYGYTFSSDVDIYYSLGLTTDQFYVCEDDDLYYRYDDYYTNIYVIDGEKFGCVYNDEVIYIFPLTDEFSGSYQYSKAAEAEE